MTGGMGISLVSVLAATVAGWVFGAVWYGALFSRQWMAAAGLTPEKINGPSGRPSPVPFVISFVLEFVMAYVLAVLFLHTAKDGITLGAALAAAFFLWLGFVFTTMAINHRYTMQPWSLTAIDGGHFLGVMLIQAGILALLGVK